MQPELYLSCAQPMCEPRPQVSPDQDVCISCQPLARTAALVRIQPESYHSFYTFSCLFPFPKSHHSMDVGVGLLISPSDSHCCPLPDGKCGSYHPSESDSNKKKRPLKSGRTVKFTTSMACCKPRHPEFLAAK